jgi:hypothetical protein
VRLLGCIVGQLYDFRHQTSGYKYSEFDLQTFAYELSGFDVTICSKQLPRIEVKRVCLLWRFSWLL